MSEIEEYVCIWTDKDGFVGRSAPRDTKPECHSFFQDRINRGMLDKKYLIEKSIITVEECVIKPLDSNDD